MDEPGWRKTMGHGGLASAVRLLGATPRLGRLFTDEEARRGADGGRAAEPRRLDPTLRREPGCRRHSRRCPRRASHRGGVLAEGFYFPSPRDEVWAPFVPHPDRATVVLGRLREGVSAGQAATEVRAILQRMEGAADRLPAGGAGGRPSGDSQNRVRVIPLR